MHEKNFFFFELKMSILTGKRNLDHTLIKTLMLSAIYELGYIHNFIIYSFTQTKRKRKRMISSSKLLYCWNILWHTNTITQKIIVHLKTLLSESFNHFCKNVGFNHFCNFVKIIFSIADNTCKHMIMTGQIIFVLLKSFLA